MARESDNDSKKDSKQLKEIMITTQEWDLIQNLVDVLEPFAEATDYLGGSSYCTHSIINPLIEQIKKELTKPSSPSPSLVIINEGITNEEEIYNEGNEDAFNEEDLEQESNDFNQHQNNLNQPVNTSNLLEIVKEKLYENLCKYWDFQDPNSLLSTLLDPRTKSLKDVPIRIQLQTKELLRDKVNELKLQNTNNDDNDDSPSLTTSSTPKKYKNSIFSRFQRPQPKSVNEEVSEYLNLDEIDWEQNPFTWWANNEKHFYYLSILARKYLPVPAASAASERMFSDAGNLMGPKRTRMNPELFKKIIFLKRNSDILPSIHPSK